MSIPCLPSRRPDLEITASTELEVSMWIWKESLCLLLRESEPCHPCIGRSAVVRCGIKNVSVLYKRSVCFSSYVFVSQFSSKIAATPRPINLIDINNKPFASSVYMALSFLTIEEHFVSSPSPQATRETRSAKVSGISSQRPKRLAMFESKTWTLATSADKSSPTHQPSPTRTWPPA